MADLVIVVNGGPVLAEYESQYQRDLGRWEGECAAIRGQFRKKTSRKEVNGAVYEYTNWYRVEGHAALKSVGKEEPNFEDYYPPRPQAPIKFTYWKFTENGGSWEYDKPVHVVLEEKDYRANQKLFKGCLVFKIEDCLNFIHPLYRNPEKTLGV